MEPTEIAYVEPALILLDPEKFTIPAGTIAVVPHGQEDLPQFTFRLEGQVLSRTAYPRLSPIFPDGFYSFTVFDLRKRFVIGINSETDEIAWGDAVIYYDDVPFVKSDTQQDIRYPGAS